MDDVSLRDCRILVAEDEYMIAEEYCVELEDAGAMVIGPAGTLKGALDLIASAPALDGAVLDINLNGEMAFPVADLLTEHRVPFVFTTGYDRSVIPSRFGHIVHFAKPVSIVKVIRAIGRVVHL